MQIFDMMIKLENIKLMKKVRSGQVRSGQWVSRLHMFNKNMQPTRTDEEWWLLII